MINNTEVKNQYETTGNINTEYPITFEGATDNNGVPHLSVRLLDAETGEVEELVLNEDYTFVAEPTGIKLGSEVLATAGNTLTITRDTPFVQEIDFQVGRIDPEQAERAADLSVLRDQELRNTATAQAAVIETHEERLDTAETNIEALQEHAADTNNPHLTSLVNLTDTDIPSVAQGMFLMYDGVHWTGVFSSSTATWGTLIGNITHQTDLMNKFAEKLSLDGSTTMTGVLKMRASISFQCAIAPYFDGVGFYKLNDDDSVTLMAAMDADDGWTPWTTNTYNMGTNTKRWKNLYLSGKAFVATLNNGNDISVPTYGGNMIVVDATGAEAGQLLTLDENMQPKWKDVPTSGYRPGIFAHEWDDHLRNDVQWLRADTFSWQDGGVYETAFKHLDDDYNAVVETTSLVYSQNGNLSDPCPRDPTGDAAGFYMWGDNFFMATPNPVVGDMGFVVSDMYVGLTVATVDGDDITLTSGSQQTFTRDASFDVSGIHYWVYTYPDETSHLFVVTPKRTLEVGDEVILIPGNGWDHYPVASITRTGLQTEATAGTSISFMVAADGHKICPADQADALTQIYSKTGTAWYYLIDSANKRFKLPRKRSTQVVASYNDGSNWLKLYADGWVEQGGVVPKNTGTTGTITLLIEMANTTYTVTSNTGNNGANNFFNIDTQPGNITTTTMTWYKSATSMAGTWQVSGMSSADMSSFQADEKYLYFYVGEFTKEALLNTAGVTTEVLNQKVDIGHEVIEFQAPTAQNNYIWYRKYADGWVEQGGVVDKGSDGRDLSSTVNLIVEMANSFYSISVIGRAEGGGPTSMCTGAKSQLSTSFFAYCYGFGNTDLARYLIWRVEGIAA